MSEGDNFAKARLESIRQSKYNTKTANNNAKRLFVDEYIKAEYKQTETVLKAADICLLLQRGIVVESYPKHDINITNEELEKLFLQIKEGANNNFIKFYQSYLRKIDLGYAEEYRDTAFEDVKTAYHTLRKCSIPGWECPDEIITETEMENLYNILVGTKPNNQPIAEKQL